MPRFPGMDPWLERPSLWPGVHAQVISTLRELLTPQLRPRHYFADIESRVYIVEEDDPARRGLIPDVVIRAERVIERGTVVVGPTPTPATALIDVIPRLPVREGRIVIRAADGTEAIAVIELLSPANKTLGSRGRSEYLAKRRDVCESSAHLIEIDLLRAGARFPMASELPPGDYYAHVSRASRRPRGEVWAWTVRDPAPVIPIPLRQGDPDALLDIGSAVRLAYERGGYDVIIDYRKPADPPLSPEDASWASALA